MMSEEKVMDKWERACQRYCYAIGAYSDEALEEMWYLCLTLEEILGLEKGASKNYCKTMMRLG